MKNVTGGTARPTTVTPARRVPPLAIAGVVALLLVVFVLRACGHHENKYEHLAHEFTQAVQANDLAAVDKFENAETKRKTTHSRLGAASDALAPLGKIKDVKETTAAGATDGNHEFLVTFDKGVATERFRIDTDDKVFSFDYKLGAPAQGS